MTDAERAELKEWIALHKSLRHILHGPDSAIINRPVEDGRFVFGVRAGHDDIDVRQEHFIVAVAQGVQTLQEQPRPLAVGAYWNESSYTVKLLGPAQPPFIRPHPTQLDVLSGRVPVAGGLLNSAGIKIPQMYPESAILLEIKTVRD